MKVYKSHKLCYGSHRITQKKKKKRTHLLKKKLCLDFSFLNPGHVITHSLLGGKILNAAKPWFDQPSDWIWNRFLRKFVSLQ